MLCAQGYSLEASPFQTRSLNPAGKETSRSIRHDPVAIAVRAFRTRLLGFEVSDPKLPDLRSTVFFFI
jgi:hypothetical protein